MILRIRRTLPPAASPIGVGNIISGLRALELGQSELDRFKAELCDHFGVKHCFLVSSGKTALTVILQALKDLHPNRDEVLIPAFTCYSVPSAIVRAGLKMRLCDVNADSFDFDEEKLDRILSTCTVTTEEFDRQGGQANCSETQKVMEGEGDRHPRGSKPFLAIVPTHLFGFTAGLDGLRRLALRKGLPIVEDAAQAMGEEWNTRKLGTCGDAGFFSLGRGKAFSAVEGGVILTDRDDIAERLSIRVESLPDYDPLEMIALICKALSLVVLQRPSLFWLPGALPFLKLGETIYNPNFAMRKMSAFQAGLARGWQNKLRKFQAIRRQNVVWCKSALSSLRVRHYCEQNGAGHSLLRFPLSIDDTAARNALLARSRDSGLGIMPSYPDSIDGIEELHGFDGRVFEQAKRLARTLVTIPVHPLVSKRDKVLIVELLEELLGAEF